jgi:tRNA pseudouridine38-40 synthase
MQLAANYLVGEHDFKSFCSVNTVAETTVRTIYDVSVTKSGNMISIKVTGSGFLYNMVRIIAGTLMEVGKGRLLPEKIPEILAALDRTKAGPTAPACGLTLYEYKFVGKN